MEAKEKQFIVTEKWLAEMKACEDGLRAFKHHFPNGGEALEVLKRCGELGYEELDYIDFGEWLVDNLPPIYTPLVLNNLIGSLFYPNDVHIKGDLSTQGRIYIKGSLKVDGKLTGNKYGVVYSYKNCVTADKIDLSGDAQIYSNTKANSISMSGYASIQNWAVADNINLSGFTEIHGNAEAKVINFKGGRIRGSVDADEIINDGGLIRGDVNTFTIENINGGMVAGKISYKHSDEHK